MFPNGGFADLIKFPHGPDPHGQDSDCRWGITIHADDYCQSSAGGRKAVIDALNYTNRRLGYNFEVQGSGRTSFEGCKDKFRPPASMAAIDRMVN